MSGDIMRRDEDGYYYILDRKKEMLKYKGHQSKLGWLSTSAG